MMGGGGLNRVHPSHGVVDVRQHHSGLMVPRPRIYDQRIDIGRETWKIDMGYLADLIRDLHPVHRDISGSLTNVRTILSFDYASIRGLVSAAIHFGSHILKERGRRRGH